MKIIGLTGGSGTGKGTVAARMRELGAGWVDADAVYRALCATNREMLAALDAAFGGVTDETGALDRPKLAQIVFSDPEKLAKLNEITIPYIRAASLEKMQAQADCPIVLYDAPTLFEAGVDELCAQTVGVLADLETRVHASSLSRTTAFTARGATTSLKTTATLPPCGGKPMLYILF